MILNYYNTRQNPISIYQIGARDKVLLIAGSGQDAPAYIVQCGRDEYVSA